VSPEVRTSPIHGRGLFAARDYLRGEKVLQYIGERISKAESLRRCGAGNQFIFAVSEAEDIDGAVVSNLARFANHSCQPNCSAECEDGEIWLVALQPISAGEELTFDYGFDLVDYREHPCHCRAPGCVGFILAEELREPRKKSQGREG
jgi:SET domain-containing protein